MTAVHASRPVQVDDRINIWLVGESGVVHRAKVVGVLHSRRFGDLPCLLQIVGPGDRTAPVLIKMGQFVVVYDQTAPSWEGTQAS